MFQKSHLLFRPRPSSSVELVSSVSCVDERRHYHLDWTIQESLLKSVLKCYSEICDCSAATLSMLAFERPRCRPGSRLVVVGSLRDVVVFSSSILCSHPTHSDDSDYPQQKRTPSMTNRIGPKIVDPVRSQLRLEWLLDEESTPLLT